MRVRLHALRDSASYGADYGAIKQHADLWISPSPRHRTAAPHFVLPIGLPTLFKANDRRWGVSTVFFSSLLELAPKINTHVAIPVTQKEPRPTRPENLKNLLTLMPPPITTATRHSMSIGPSQDDGDHRKGILDGFRTVPALVYARR